MSLPLVWAYQSVNVRSPLAVRQSRAPRTECRILAPRLGLCSDARAQRPAAHSGPGSEAGPRRDLRPRPIHLPPGPSLAPWAAEKAARAGASREVQPAHPNPSRHRGSGPGSEAPPASRRSVSFPGTAQGQPAVPRAVTPAARPPEGHRLRSARGSPHRPGLGRAACGRRHAVHATRAQALTPSGWETRDGSAPERRGCRLGSGAGQARLAEVGAPRGRQSVRRISARAHWPCSQGTLGVWARLRCACAVGRGRFRGCALA